MISHSKYPMLPLGEVVRTSSGDSTIIKGRLSKQSGQGLYPAFSASGQDVFHNRFTQKGEAVILSAVGARCGKCFLAEGMWSAIANTHIVWPKKDAVVNEYLYYLLNDETFWVRGGSAQPFVKVKATLEKSVPIPDLPEQRRIVVRIQECLSRVEEMERLQGAMTYDLGLLDVSLIDSLIDPRWPTKQLTEATESIRNGWSSQQDPNGIEVGALKLSCVHTKTIDETDSKPVKVSSRAVEDFAITKDDVFLVRGNGSAHLVGRTAIARRSNQEVIFNDLLIRLRAGKGLLPEFLNLICHSRGVRAQILDHARTAAGIWKINQVNLGKIRIPVPDLERQQAFVNRVTSSLACSSELRRLSTPHDLSALRNAILRQAFAGEL